MVDVAIHTRIDQTTANVSGYGDTHWLRFSTSRGEVTIFADAAQADAFRMIADIFNDAFAQKHTPAPVEEVSDDDGVPF